MDKLGYWDDYVQLLEDVRYRYREKLYGFQGVLYPGNGSKIE